MPVPNLIHPVPIDIQQIVKSETIYDDDLREPVQQAARPVTVKTVGQVKWNSQFELESQLGGAVEGSRGYVLFRRIDLEIQGIVLANNDRISKMGVRDTDVYITRLEPVGHYPDQSGHTLIKAHFNDRAPARQTRGS